MRGIWTDLALEAHGGVPREDEKLPYGIERTVVNIETQQMAEELGRPMGTYGETKGHVCDAQLPADDDHCAGYAQGAQPRGGQRNPPDAAWRREMRVCGGAGQSQRDAGCTGAPDGGARTGDAAYAGLSAGGCIGEAFQRMRALTRGAGHDGDRDGGGASRDGSACEARRRDRGGRPGGPKLIAHLFDDPDRGYGHCAGQRRG